MDIPTYGAQWRARALADTKQYWTPLRATLTIAAPVITGLLWCVFRQWEGWCTVIQGTLISIVGFFALWGLAFFVGLLLAPGKIHAEQKDTITVLKETISTMNAKPKITAMEQEQRRLVGEKLAQFSDAEVEAVRYVLHHGRVHYLRLAQQFGDTVAEVAARKAFVSGLIVQSILQNSPNYDINPLFEPALTDYFTNVRPVTPSSG